MPEKIKIQEYLRINKGMKNMRTSHIVHTLSILHLFEV